MIAHNRILLAKVARGIGNYTKKDIREAKEELGKVEVDRIYKEAKQKLVKFKRRAPGSFGSGKRR